MVETTENILILWFGPNKSLFSRINSNSLTVNVSVLCFDFSLRIRIVDYIVNQTRIDAEDTEEETGGKQLFSEVIIYSLSARSRGQVNWLQFIVKCIKFKVLFYLKQYLVLYISQHDVKCASS